MNLDLDLVQLIDLELFKDLDLNLVSELFGIFKHIHQSINKI